MRNSGPILDYFFEAGDFALFASAMSPFRVKILGETRVDGDKYYIVAGPEQLMAQEEIKGTDAFGSEGVPTGWVVTILEPDDLEICFKSDHLTLVKGV